MTDVHPQSGEPISGTHVIQKRPGPRLTEGGVEAQLARMSAPMLGGIAATMTFGLVDAYFVAKLGTDALAALSFTFPVVMILISTAIGLGAGTSSVVARAIGEGDERYIKRLATDSMILAGLSVLVLSVLGALSINPLFRLLGADETTLPLIREYMLIWFLGIPFLIVPMVGNSAVRATGNTKLPGLIMVAGALINIVLDPLLIFGIAGFPELGLRGAAIATVISRALTLIASIWILWRVEDLLTFEIPPLSEIWTSWRAILSVGVPAAATNMIIPLSLAALQPLLASFGSEAVAAFGAATRVESIALMLFFALSSVIGPFVGQNAGAGRADRVRRALQSSFLFCLAFGAIAAAALYFGRDPLAGLFTDQAAVAATAALYLTLLPISYGAHGIVMQANAVFNALGMPLRAVAISVLRMLVLYLPLAWLGARSYGLSGLFAGAAVANLISGGVAAFWALKSTLPTAESPAGAESKG